MGADRYGWTRLLRRSAPDLPYESPIWLGNHSNGEYFHTQTPHERRLRDAILRAGDEKARKLGIDRREFMASAAGFVTALTVLQQACSSKDGGSGAAPSDVATGSGTGGTAPAGTGGTIGSPTTGAGAGGTTGSSGAGAVGAGAGGVGDATSAGAGGTNAPSTRDPNQPGQYCFEDSGVDPTLCEEAARAALAGPDFIVDCQTHCFDDAPDAAWRTSPPPGFNESLAGLLGLSCPDPDKVSCIGRDDYARLMFLQSDTSVAVLSVWPYGQGPNDPNNNAFIASTRDWVNADLAGSQRVVNHASVVPPFGTGQMQGWADTLGVAGWKVYPASYPYFFMDDDTGRAVIENAIAAGVKTFAIHKGLPIQGFMTEQNRPRDIGVVAKAYPDVNFIVYHSAICAGQPASGFTCSPMEGPYVDGSTDGSDALITSLKENGIGPNQNVYAELGGAFSQLVANPAVAGQWLAKLVEHVGENNVVWGTDAILSGNSPQGLINAFNALQHPMLTAEVKKKILGLNAARLYCIDPAAKRCQVLESELAQHKRRLDDEFGPYRQVLLGQHRPLGPTTRREFLNLVRYKRAMGIPG